MFNSLKAKIQAVASQKVADSHARFFKERPLLLGITTPVMRQIAQEFWELPLTDITTLLNSQYQEERFLALLILIHHYKKNPEAIYHYYLDHLDYINNWNLVDCSAHLIVGDFLLKKERTPLYKLAHATNMWHRRVAIVSTWAFIKKNDVEETGLIAQKLLNDSEDLIHKATGWMLREAGKKSRPFLDQFLETHHVSMPRTMLRYAIEKLSPEERAIWMKQTKNYKTT